jgi:hypothetical protein
MIRTGQRLGIIAGLTLAIQTPCAQAAAPPSSDGRPLSVLGAYVGMSREAWSALPPPGGHAAEVHCSASPTTDPLDAPAVPHAAAADQDLTCAYVRRFGRFGLPVSARLPGGLKATQLRYTFRNGRLQRISYQLPVDAYDRLMADFHARFGAADEVRRDTLRTAHGRLPRVSQVWRTSTGVVQIIDPVAPYSRLLVRLSAFEPPLGPAAREDRSAAIGDTGSLPRR